MDAFRRQIAELVESDRRRQYAQDLLDSQWKISPQTYLHTLIVQMRPTTEYIKNLTAVISNFKANGHFHLDRVAVLPKERFFDKDLVEFIFTCDWPTTLMQRYETEIIFPRVGFHQ